MKKTMATIAMTAMFALAFAAPAFAVDGSGGAGAKFGRDHAVMAAEMVGFTGAMNPGVHHHGFAGWDGTMMP